MWERWKSRLAIRLADVATSVAPTKIRYQKLAAISRSYMSDAPLSPLPLPPPGR
jgi:hypothetical protein